MATTQLGLYSTGSDVKKLQEQLNAQGANPPLAVDGQYGPKTAVAVKQFQVSNGLTADGIAGPITQSALSGTQTQAKPVDTKTQPINPQLAEIGAIGKVNQNAIQASQSVMSVNEALKLAAKDPNIIAKYADMAKLDQQSFTQQLETAQTLYGTEAQLQKTKFENERKQLANAQAEAGTAYSGFRGKAQKDLLQQESGIVTSTRAQHQQALNQLTSYFETKYGSSATPKASLSTINPLGANVSPTGLSRPDATGTETLTGEKAGGITGTEPVTKQSDIISKAQDIRNLNANPI